jgi:hypothetical protein
MKTTALHNWRRDMSLETVLVAIRRWVFREWSNASLFPLI